MQQLFKVLCATEDLASYTLVSVAESEEWAAIISSVATARLFKGNTIQHTVQ
jgi:hypothetical protein